MSALMKRLSLTPSEVNWINSRGFFSRFFETSEFWLIIEIMDL